MSSEIGLAEFIQQVKRELLTTYPDSENDTPLLSVDSVELELQVTVKKEGSGGIKIKVLQFGGGEISGKLSRDDVQKVKVKLSPLVSKEALINTYGKQNPEKYQEFVDQTLRGILKGGAKSNLNEDLGG
jgi:Trypsin-co-occurring domain 2